MKMPQSSRAFKALPLSLMLLCASAAPGFAQDDAAPDRVQLYVCGTGDDAGAGYLQLTGIATPDDTATFGDLRLERLRADNQPIWSFPPAGVDGETAFLFSHSNGPEGYLVTIRIDDAGTIYTLYSLYQPPDPDDPYDAGGASGGLISARDGRIVEDVECNESPYEFIEYMRRSMSCDTASPYGPNACEEHEPTRPARIDIARIGLD